MKTVMIVAGESSGELYGSLLAKALRSMWPDIRLIGIGGELMRSAGVELLSGISSSFGLTEALLSFGKIRESFKKASKALTEFSPDVVVPIDFPDFNFRLAGAAKKKELKVLYYVSPQIWAWRKRRIKTMRRIADKVAVILPFEEALYRNSGIPCEFVGHPAMEEIEDYERSRKGDSPIEDRDTLRVTRYALRNVALLPGSRPHELGTLLPVFIDLVKLIKDEFNDFKFIIPIAPNTDSGRFREHLSQLEKMGVTVSKGEAIKALSSSDIAVIASGTSTLQAALLGIPMVVVYKLSPLTFFIGKRIVDVKYISLVNILSDKPVVPELIQDMATAGNIMKHFRKILYDEDYRAVMKSSLDAIRALFSNKRPSRRVAEMIGGLAGWTSTPESLRLSGDPACTPESLRLSGDPALKTKEFSSNA